ncbi:MAG: PKD domain-containing protein [Reichenbachiella sp.]|uniref:PKD domain-containing protein n=1 Tax=Reichenbachiella sp. TaxID=2184521 RepID=UPI003297DC91
MNKIKNPLSGLLVMLVSFGYTQAQGVVKNLPLSVEAVVPGIISDTSFIGTMDERIDVQMPLQEIESIQQSWADRMTETEEESTARVLETQGFGAGAASTGTGQGISWMSTKPNISVPPSPTAGSLTISGNSSVDMYSGAARVNIPLFNYSRVDVDLDISLNYSSNGVKVNDVAGWVGMGWNLKAGGSISRVLKGLPDEFVGGIGAMCRNCLPFDAVGYLDLKNSGVDLSKFTSDSYTNTKKQKIIRNGNWQTLDGRNHGDGLGTPVAWDTQPDEFYFNFGNYSGKFLFDQEGNIFCMPKQNLIIDKKMEDVDINDETHRMITEFTVTTPEGYTYVFGGSDFEAIESSQLVNVSKTINYSYRKAKDNNGWIEFYNSDGTRAAGLWERLPRMGLSTDRAGNIEYDTEDQISKYSTYTSTWYLKRIESPTNHWVNFSYNQPDNTLFYVMSRNQRVSIPNLVEYAYNPDNDNNYYWFFITDGTTPRDQFVTFSRDELLVDSRQLSEVNFDDGSQVRFQATTEREDLLGINALNKITIINNEGQIAKSYELDYSYNQPDLPDSQLSNQTVWALEETNISETEVEIILFPEYEGQTGAELIVSERKRLQLDNIKEIGLNSSRDLFSFKYNETALPRRTSYAQDKYGFFNKNYTGSTIPRISYTDFLGGNSHQSGHKFFTWYNMNSSQKAFSGANQASDSERAKAGVLEKVIDANGGIKEFKYSLGIGALKVSAMLYYPNPSDEQKYLQNNYIYTPSSTVASPFFSTSYLITNEVVNYDNQRVEVSSVPIGIKNQIAGVPNVYDKVTESMGEGVSIYDFRSTDDVEVEVSNSYVVTDTKILQSYDLEYPYPQPTDLEWKRGAVISHQVLNQEQKQIELTENTYNPDDVEKETIYGIKSGIRYDDYDRPIYYGGLYKYETDWIHMDKKVISKNDQINSENSIELVNEQKYKSLNPGLLDYTLTKYENGSQIKNEFSYVFDLTQGDRSLESTESARAIWKLKDKNAIALPIEVVQSIKKDQGEFKIIGGQLIEYACGDFFESSANSDVVLKRRLYQLNTKTSIISSSFTKASLSDDGSNFSFNEKYKVAESIDDYDEFGNPLKSTLSNGLITEFEWKHNGTLMKSQTIGNQTTKYDHRPLVGVTKVTDPNNRSSIYEYDEFNRLRLIRDHNGDIVERYRYHNMSSVGELSAGIITSCTLQDFPIYFQTSSQANYYGDTQYTWDFGDGTVIEDGGKSVSHTYESTGTFQLILTIQNDEYETVCETRTVVVQKPVDAYLIFAAPQPHPGSFDLTAIIETLGAAHCGEVDYYWQKSVNDGVTWTEFTSSREANVSVYDTREMLIRVTVSDDATSVVSPSILLNEGGTPEGDPGDPE